MPSSNRLPSALTAEGDFAFSLLPFTPERLAAARHADELTPEESLYLYIDHKMRGLGSHSCGPEPEAEYELNTEAFTWSFRLKAEKTQN